jgi:hypothetical protein
VDYQPRHQHMVEVASKNSLLNVANDLWIGIKKKWEIKGTRDFISWRKKTKVGAVGCPNGTNSRRLKTQFTKLSLKHEIQNLTKRPPSSLHICSLGIPLSLHV